MELASLAFPTDIIISLQLHLVHRYVGNDSIPYIFNDLVVAAVFFTVTDHENTNGTVLQLITDHMKFIRKKGTNIFSLCIIVVDWS